MILYVSWQKLMCSRFGPNSYAIECCCGMIVFSGSWAMAIEI